MLARTDSRARALVLLIAASLVIGGIGARLVWWQVIERDRLAGMALQQLARHEQIPAARGEILDVNGVVLATSVEVSSIFATPPTLDDPQAAAAALSRILDEPADELAAVLSSETPFVYLARRVTPIVAERVRELGMRGIGLLPETQRVYPIEGVAEDTTIAAQVLGFVNVDGAGQSGVELAEEALLAGTPGSMVAHEDVVGHRIADSVSELAAPVDGATLRLTIDAGLQHLLETELLSTFERNEAHGAVGIVMDVETGAIRALASFPSFDANAYATTDPELFANPAVARAFEPGSVMKVFTVAAALEAGAIETTDTFVDDNNLVIADLRIQNADRHDFPYGHGPLTARDMLRLSNNVGAAKIGLELGRQGLYEAFRHFGFGEPTGIELSGEQSGVVWNPDGPNGSGDLTTAQNAFGQGLSVTAVQLVAGYAALANGGILVRPHLVAGWTDPDGTDHSVAPDPGRRIVSEETAAIVLRLMTAAIDDGIASAASVPGYSVAGKTGTAQIAGPVEVEVPNGVDEEGNPRTTTIERWEYIDGWIDSSFIGILPAKDPELVTLILLHRPSIWGVYQMAEEPTVAFSRLAPRILDYLAIPPDRPLDTAAAP